MTAVQWRRLSRSTKQCLTHLILDATTTDDCFEDYTFKYNAQRQNIGLTTGLLFLQQCGEYLPNLMVSLDEDRVLLG